VLPGIIVQKVPPYDRLFDLIQRIILPEINNQRRLAVADLSGNVGGCFFSKGAEADNRYFFASAAGGLRIIIQPAKQCMGKKAVALVTIECRLLVVGGGVNMQPHFFRQHGNTGVIQAADNEINTTGMAGVKDKQLMKRFYFFGHIHNLIGADEMSAGSPAVIFSCEYVILVLQKHSMACRKEDEAVLRFDFSGKLRDFGGYIGFPGMVIRQKFTMDILCFVEGSGLLKNFFLDIPGVFYRVSEIYCAVLVLVYSYGKNVKMGIFRPYR